MDKLPQSLRHIVRDREADLREAAKTIRDRIGDPSKLTGTQKMISEHSLERLAEIEQMIDEAVK